jgi:hypothetical protein
VCIDPRVFNLVTRLRCDQFYAAADLSPWEEPRAGWAQVSFGRGKFVVSTGN